ncbi:MAG: hypothetical protein OIF40_05415 [Mangrovicoccus sp.]|nr:hypothetical protein [Mangrovicoccus sp.]
MELAPGEYGFTDLRPGDGFATAWLCPSPEACARFGALTGAQANPQNLPALLILSMVEGAKQSGPVQIQGRLIRRWEITSCAPGTLGQPLRGRYEITATREAGANGLVQLGLDITERSGTMLLRGAAQLLMARP